MTERARTHSWDDPHEFIQLAAGLPGLEVMRRMAAGDRPQPAIASTLGFRLAEVERGRAVFEVEPAELEADTLDETL